VVGLTVRELSPENDEQAEQVALVISQVFNQPVPDAPMAEHQTLLEALHAGIATQLAVLGDASLTETGQSSADLLEVPGAVLAEKITIHLLREIVVRGSRGGPLFPLTAQLNADMTHMQGTGSKGRSTGWTTSSGNTGLAGRYPCGDGSTGGLGPAPASGSGVHGPGY
jgi:hypothetical protein